jgi:hypothetical protein
MIVTRTLHLHRYLQSYSTFTRILTRAMSFQSALSKLPYPIKDLVTVATRDGSQDFGKSEKDQAEVIEWVEKAANGTVVTPSALKVRWFIVSHDVVSTGDIVGSGFSACSSHIRRW